MVQCAGRIAWRGHADEPRPPRRRPDFAGRRDGGAAAQRRRVFNLGRRASGAANPCDNKRRDNNPCDNNPCVVNHHFDHQFDHHRAAIPRDDAGRTVARHLPRRRTRTVCRRGPVRSERSDVQLRSPPGGAAARHTGHRAGRLQCAGTSSPGNRALRLHARLRDGRCPIGPQLGEDGDRVHRPGAGDDRRRTGGRHRLFTGRPRAAHGAAARGTGPAGCRRGADRPDVPRQYVAAAHGACRRHSARRAPTRRPDRRC